MDTVGTMSNSTIRRTGVVAPVYSRKQTYAASGNNAVPMKWPVRPIEKTRKDSDISSTAPPITQKLIITNNTPIGTLPTSRLATMRRMPSSR